MKFLKKLFGRVNKQNVTQEVKVANTRMRPAEKKQSIEEMRRDPELIQVFDAYGREMFIGKESWRTEVLPGNIQNSWNNADELYGIIVNALNDGFAADVISAAKRLVEIDTIPERSCCILGIVLMKNGSLADAEKVLKDYLVKYGESGVVLTNLAKVYAENQDSKLAEETLWHALEVDPNQDNAFEWYVSIQNERSGGKEYVATLEKVAGLKGSWRAQLWLGREALESQDYTTALDYYDGVIRGFEQIPPDVMMQVSGDLGNAGRVNDIIRLFGERFDPESHGLMAGNNLLKASFEVGDFKRAKSILDRMYKLKRPDWTEHLSYWDNQLELATGKYGDLKSDEVPAVAMLTLDWPVWAHKLTGFEEILPEKAENAPKVCFISSTCEYERLPDHTIVQKTDKEGTLCRSIPLLISEQLYMKTTARSNMMIPVVASNGGFVMTPHRWALAQMVELGERMKVDYVCSGHLVAKGALWNFTMSLVDVEEKKVLSESMVKLDSMNPAKGVLELRESMMMGLQKLKGVVCLRESDSYSLPRQELINNYLSASAQSLALTVATSGTSNGRSLYGERSIFNELLELALQDLSCEVTRLMFLSGLAKNKAYGSEIYKEYASKVDHLFKEAPVSGESAKVVQNTLNSLYGDSEN